MIFAFEFNVTLCGPGHEKTSLFVKQEWPLLVSDQVAQGGTPVPFRTQKLLSADGTAEVRGEQDREWGVFLCRDSLCGVLFFCGTPERAI